MLLVRLLVVEDERKLAQVLASALSAEHYDVVVAATGEDGFFRAKDEAFDLVLLDLMLPGRSGLEILQTLRKRHVQTPVLILTARDGVDDRVLGLDLGADDYLVKPFGTGCSRQTGNRIQGSTRRDRKVETGDIGTLTEFRMRGVTREYIKVDRVACDSTPGGSPQSPRRPSYVRGDSRGFQLE